MTWWHWLVVGLVLIALEMAASGGFYVIFFGVAALAIAALQVMDVAGPVWFQLLLFSTLSIVSLFLFRGPLLRRLQLGEAGRDDYDTLVGEVGLVQDPIPAGGIGRIELRGSTWTARNVGAMGLERGRRCVVVRRDRLTLFVQAEEAV